MAQLGGRLVEYSDILSGKKVKLTGIISVMIYKSEDCDRVSLVSLFFFVKRYCEFYLIRILIILDLGIV